MDDPLLWVRAVHFAATFGVSGTVLFDAAVAEPAWRGRSSAVEASTRPSLAVLAWTSLVLALASGAAWLVLQVARMVDLPWTLAIRSEALLTVVIETDFGRDWLVRLGLAAMLGALLALHRMESSAIRRMLACAVALGFSGTLAWGGHAAGTPGLLGTVHLGSDALHLAAAASWLGALVPLALLLAAAQRCGDAPCFAIARCAVVRFSMIGVVSVGALVVTGIVNTWILVGSLDVLTGSTYGRLLTGKVAVFLAMLALAAVNRLWLTPQLDDADEAARRGWGALARIRRNTVAEAAAGALIIAMVSALGMLAPSVDDGP